RLECAGGVVVQLPVGGLLRLTSPEVKVRFVPYLEIPAADFVAAVTCNEMFGELRDQLVPLGPVFRWRDVRPVPERVWHVLGRELLRHEAEFNERPHSIGQQTIV